MFYHMGEHRHGSSLAFNGVHQDMVNNKIEAFSKAFLATTVACARCHDHKLEAVSQRDYYALAAVFMTPRWTSRVVDAPGKNDAAIHQLTRLRAEIRQEMARLWRKAAQQPQTWPATKWQQAIAAKDGKRPAIEDDFVSAVAVEIRKRRCRQAVAGTGRGVAEGARRAPEAQPGVHRPRGLRQTELPGRVGDGRRRNPLWLCARTARR